MRRYLVRRRVGQRVISHYVAHLGLTPNSDEATSVRPASPKVAVDVLDMDLDAKDDWNLSYIPPSGVFDGRSSLREDFSLTQEKYNGFSIGQPSTAGDLFQLALRGSNIEEQRQLLPCVGGLRSDARESTGYVQALER